MTRHLLLRLAALGCALFLLSCTEQGGGAPPLASLAQPGAQPAGPTLTTAPLTSGGATPSSSAAPASAAPAPLGRLAVRGRFLRDARGRAVFLRGVNYSHRTKSAPQVSWQRRDHLAKVREWGFNCVRYVVLWSLLEPTPGQLDSAYLDHVEQVLAWAEQEGLYVLLDMHQDLFSSVFGGDGAPAWAAVDHFVHPNPIAQPWYLNYFQSEVVASFDRFHRDAALQDHYLLAWTAVAERARRHSNVVGYDLYNEPYPGTETPWALELGPLRALYERLMVELRARDPDAIVFVEPVAASSDFGVPTALPLGALAAQGPLVYAPHFYDALLMARRPSGPVASLLGLTVHVGQADAAGVPLFLGEIGAPRSAPGAGARLEEQLRALEEALVAGWALWNHNPEPGTNLVAEPAQMFLAAPGHPDSPVLTVARRPYARAVAGDPRSFRWDAAVGRLTLVIGNPDPGADTELYLPAGAFPSFTVSVPGTWSFDPATRVLRHRAAPGGRAQTLVVRR
ncbi:MAG: cellulase family glycosylhydrolase [Planctomycetota bacterium]